MTEITRQHLEDAARAAGHEVVCTEAESHGCEDHSAVYTGLMLRGIQEAWRPHLDDGDAMRLAVRLNFTADCDENACSAETDDALLFWGDWHDGTEPDKRRAWRKSVLLCAAAVGERMRDALQYLMYCDNGEPEYAAARAARAAIEKATKP